MVITNLERLILDEYSGNVLEALTFLENYYHEILKEDPSLVKIHPEFQFSLKTEAPNEEQATWTSHFKNIHMHLILEGSQTIEFCDMKYLTPQVTDYDKDYALYQPAEGRGTVLLEKGDMVLFYPEDAHRVSSQASEIKKLIFKIVLG